MELTTASRRARLITIMQLWERQLSLLEDTAYTHFREQNLQKIADLITRKRKLERRIANMQSFLKRL